MKHYFLVIAKILKSSYPYGKGQVLVCYLKLLITSYKYAHFSKREKPALFKENLLGYTVAFYSYPRLITLFEEIFVCQCYSFKADVNNPQVIDCGSNIGLSVLYFKKIYPSSRIICFEPDPENFDILSKNISSNNLKDVQFHNYALSDKEAMAVLYKEIPFQGALNTSLFDLNIKAEVISISTKLLSEFLKFPVDFLKIDIEGSEDLVVEDLCKTGKIELIKKMIIEYHPYCRHELEDVTAMLKPYGFKDKILNIDLHANAPEKLILLER